MKMIYSTITSCAGVYRYLLGNSTANMPELSCLMIGYL